MTKVFKMIPDDPIKLIKLVNDLKLATVDDWIKMLKRPGDDLTTVLKRVDAIFDNPAVKHLSRLFLLDMNEPGTADRRWALLWDGVDVLLPELVSLAKIQPPQYRGFALAVHDRLLEFIEWDWPDACDEDMLKAEKLLRAAQDAISALSESQCIIVSRAMSVADPEAGDPTRYDDWTQQIPRMLAGIAKITGSARYRSNEATRSGPKRERSHGLVLREFIRDLWSIAHAHGGNFTVWEDPDAAQMDDASGTMVEALHLLEPVLPHGFVSNTELRLSAKMLNRLRPRP
jgi:hypothetical protein